MKKIWFLTYNILFLPVFWVAVRLFAIFNEKARKAIAERKSLFYSLKQDLKSFDKSKKNILIHCSSLGEFEQAKPVIQELDKTGSFNFLISFFSPSGYHHAKLDYKLKSAVTKIYLPFDDLTNVKRFLAIVNPVAAIFIKYDLWFNLLYELEKRNVFKFLVNATYSEKSFKWKFFLTRSYRRVVYNFFNVISTADEDDAKNLKNVLSKNVEIYVLGDTKLERIKQAKENSMTKTLLNSSIINDKKVLVIGSSWDSDMEIILPVLNKITSGNTKRKLLTVIAPHEPSVDNISNIENNLAEQFINLKSIRYSNIDNYSDENIILIDCVGLLLTLYKYADIAYVGGSWQAGLHNVMEPAGYGIPVLFGNDKITDDADLLIKKGGGIPVEDSKTFYRNLANLLDSSEERERFGANSSSVFEAKNEASKKISELLQKYIKLNGVKIV
jgi:3-deoxy-D-manno-octulosonic-acid transferase